MSGERVDSAPETALNRICPYFTMFPLRFPYGILRRRAAAGDVVLDPFCGRGTTSYASRLLGLASVAVDSSPVAVAITRAKAAQTTPERILAAYDRLANDAGAIAAPVPVGEFWRWAFHDDVLGLLVRLRSALGDAPLTPEADALRGILLGALHGPLAKREASHLSNQSPRTFAPKPDYAARYWRERDLRPPRVAVRAVIARRAARYYGRERGAGPIVVAHGDAGALELRELMPAPARWVITSPPYYGMRTYLPDQWLRAWLLGGPAVPSYRDTRQLSHASPERFADGLRDVWRRVRAAARDDARLVIRFGAISDRPAEPTELLSASLVDAGWRTLTRRCAGAPPLGRRQAEHFQRRCSRAPVEFDLWAAAA